MPNLTAGQSATIDIPAGMPCYVSSTQDAYVDLVSGAPGAGYTSDRLAGNRLGKLFGPWTVAAKITIRCILGTATYGGAYSAEPGRLGARTTSEISAINAAIAAGTASYPIGSTVINSDEGTSYKLSGLATSASFVEEGAGSPVKLSGVSGVGQVVTAILAAGWLYDSVQWKKNVSGAISNATGAGSTTLNYTQVSADVVPGVMIYPDFANLRYIAVLTASISVPGAPTIGTATAGDGTVFVAFTAPASNGGGAIIDYLVTLSDGSTVTTGASPAAFVGKTNGVSYTGIVQARNVQGYGAASASSNAVTPTASATSRFISESGDTFISETNDYLVQEA